MTRRPLPVVLCVLLAATTVAAEPTLTDPAFQLVESWPVETVLDQPDLPEAADVWLEMIRGAQTEICVESFYFSDDPDDDDDPLDRVLAALEEAGARGVDVKLLGDAGFHRTYPEILDRFAALPGCASRLIDARSAWGGVQHAKFMIVDGKDAYVGSQNWDWRALMHIHELGARVRHPQLAAAIHAVFAHDWALAGGETPPAATAQAGPFDLTSPAGPLRVSLAASPPSALPDGVPHDLAPLLALVDGAERELRVQVLSYHPTSRDGSDYLELDTALRRAAGRGVAVRLIVSNWAKRASQLPWLQSLACVPGLEVRFTNIPEWSRGFVPFARVEHPKFLVADGKAGWIGTSNWGPGYFSDSRNLSLMIEGEGVAAQLTRIFDTSWDGPYAEPVDPGRDDYEPPRRQ